MSIETLSIPRPRDADNTRLLLLAAARRRFAADGYVATTVRDIASEAGVNVALINRYFTSKEGLFEACLATAVNELGESVSENLTVEEILQIMTAQVAGAPNGDAQLRLMLLLRSSGDEGADQIRRDVFRTFAERLARSLGWRPEQPDNAQLVLRSEIALSAILGIIVVRSSTGLQPLTSADEAELSAPLRDMLGALFRHAAPAPVSTRPPGGNGR
jgi:AcrR family transcriptional regulator